MHKSKQKHTYYKNNIGNCIEINWNLCMTYMETIIKKEVNKTMVQLADLHNTKTSNMETVINKT
jgi:hypothetical protein